MIIRIMGEGQFRVKSSLFDALNKIDNKIVECVHKGDEKEYKKNLAKLISTIKKEGKPVDDKELVESDVIVPMADLTIKEAADVFTGTGIFKD
jgi:hypothetical protein